MEHRLAEEDFGTKPALGGVMLAPVRCVCGWEPLGPVGQVRQLNAHIEDSREYPVCGDCGDPDPDRCAQCATTAPCKCCGTDDAEVCVECAGISD